MRSLIATVIAIITALATGVAVGGQDELADAGAACASNAGILPADIAGTALTYTVHPGADDPDPSYGLVVDAPFLAQDYPIRPTVNTLLATLGLDLPNYCRVAFAYAPGQVGSVYRFAGADPATLLDSFISASSVPGLIQVPPPQAGTGDVGGRAVSTIKYPTTPQHDEASSIVYQVGDGIVEVFEPVTGIAVAEIVPALPEPGASFPETEAPAGLVPAEPPATPADCGALAAALPGELAGELLVDRLTNATDIGIPPPVLMSSSGVGGPGDGRDICVVRFAYGDGQTMKGDLFGFGDALTCPRTRDPVECALSVLVDGFATEFGLIASGGKVKVSKPKLDGHKVTLVRVTGLGPEPLEFYMAPVGQGVVLIRGKDAAQTVLPALIAGG